MASKSTLVIEETRHALLRKKTDGKMNGKNAAHGKGSILELTGIFSEKEAKEIKKAIKESRKRSRARMKRFRW